MSVLFLNLFRLFYLELRKSGKAETGHRSAPRYVWPVFIYSVLIFAQIRPCERHKSQFIFEYRFY